jgi:MscS family membrane protein
VAEGKTEVKVPIAYAKLLSVKTLFVLLSVLLLSPSASPQAPVAGSNPPENKVEVPKDTLGRETPRGAVLGFLNAAHKGNNEIAVLYLNTPLRGSDAEKLAHQLSVVLDRRLPPRLNLLSAKPEGSLSDPLNPNQDLVGTIDTNNGELSIFVERVDRGKSGMVWLFSSKTLKAIPEAFQELRATGQDVFPEFLVRTRIGNISLFEWLVLIIGPPLLYLITALLNRFLNLVFGFLRRKIRNNPNLPQPELLPKPIRLLLLALAIRWPLSEIGLSLLARQIWSAIAVVIFVAACVWLLILLSGGIERYLLRKVQNRNLQGIASVLRLTRRVVDIMLAFAGCLLILFYFGVNLTAALAGLGVGGIAVALAAQKTLENVIGGISIILDKAMTVGDTLKLGDLVGTIEDIGLRSTRIRTLDRTMVVVPNGQIANATIETLSARDKFWFHPVISLRFETSPAQILSIVARIRKLLFECSIIETDSVRVRFFRLGAYSFDLDIFGYLFARDWNQFLEIQETLLLDIMDIVKQAGADIAFPSQTMYFSRTLDDREELPAAVLTPAPKSALEKTATKSA